MNISFLLNIGNTHTVAARRCNDTLEIAFRAPTSSVISGEVLGEFCAYTEEAPCLCACVVPEAAARLASSWEGGLIRFLTAQLVTEVDFSGVDGRTLGADRVANAVAAVAGVGAPCIVLDCGTAITTEVVDRHRRFLGGTIMPGRRLLREALHQHTAQLPLVELREELANAIGANTWEAILAGVDGGVVGAVEAVVRRALEQLGESSCPVIATGGDASFFVTHVAGVVAAAEEFTLQGLAVVADRLFGSRL